MFQIPNVKNVYMYPKPIPMNWSEKKLTQLARDEMGVEPARWQVFLFFNKKQDQMKVFFYDDTGSQEFLKMLPQGGFVLPVARDGEKFVKIDRKKLGTLFRT